MDSKSADTSSQHPIEASDVKPSASSVSEQDSSAHDSSSMECKSSISSWARSLKGPQPLVPAQENSQTGNAGKPTFARLASGLGLNLAQKASGPNENSGDTAAASSTGVLESFRKGLVDSSLNAVKAVQVKAHHVVSQNKRRYQIGKYGGFQHVGTRLKADSYLAFYSAIADHSLHPRKLSEGSLSENNKRGYRNHMEEVIKFFETHHKDKYKVYNLCSERLYDASLFEGKVASFPFDGHNFPPIHLIPLFCQSAYSWLKDDILNVVAVHCKAGKARTGLMICSLLLFLKFFPTAEECIDYYNQKRCVDGKGLILPSQIRYVKYYEHILTNYSGQNPPGRRCMLRGFRLHTCPYWVRPSITVSNHNARRFLDSCTKKRDCGFALPGEPGLTELKGDIKIHFQDRHGDFYCWLNTAMMENRLILNASDLDDFDKRKLPSPGFKVETVMIDYDGTTPARYKVNQDSKGSNQSSKNGSSSTNEVPANSNQSKVCGNQDNDDVFSNSDGEEAASSCRSLSKVNCGAGTAATTESGKTEEQIASVKKGTKQLLLGSKEPTLIDTSNEIRNDKVGSSIPNLGSGDIKAIAADASVFTFGDDEDYESE